MHDSQKRRMAIDKSSLLVSLLALAFVAMNILRILQVPVTHDEGVTYNWYISAFWLDIISIHPTTANDHILNSLLSKAFMALFGKGQFWLRFTNLLAQLVYIYFSWRIIRSLFTDKVLIVLCFLLLNLNPFLFEFWGLCRGYGLSLALTMGSIYYLLVYLRVARNATLWYCLFFSMAAVYANYALLYFFLALPPLILFGSLLKGKPRKLLVKELAVILGCSLALFLTTVGNLKALSDEGQFYYGGDKDIVHDTIASLVRESLYMTAPAADNVTLMLAYALLASVLLTGVYFITGVLRKRNSERMLIGLCLYLLLLIPLLGIALHHALLNSKLLIERTALFLVPLFVLQFIYAIGSAGRSMARASLAILAIMAAVNFFTHLNFRTSRSWPDDAPALLILRRMDKEGKTRPGKIKLRCDWRVQPALQYYIATGYHDRFAWVQYDQDSLNGDTSFDYYYIYHDDLAFVPPVYKPDTIVSQNRFILLSKYHQ